MQEIITSSFSGGKTESLQEGEAERKKTQSRAGF